MKTVVWVLMLTALSGCSVVSFIKDPSAWKDDHLMGRSKEAEAQWRLYQYFNEPVNRTGGDWSPTPGAAISCSPVTSAGNECVANFGDRQTRCYTLSSGETTCYSD